MPRVPGDFARVFALWTALGLFGCDDVSAFRGQFEGNIVAGSFVRRCFAPNTTAVLRFDPDLAVAAALEGVPEASRNKLTTVDAAGGEPLFQDTVLHPLEALPSDQLSLLDFPGPRRRRNYLLLARPREGLMAGQDATVVVSLLDDEAIEVRVLGRTPDTSLPCPEDPSQVPAGAPRVREVFGVFRLEKK